MKKKTEMTNDFLCHHGILGQKWGIRRYQNPDGSLTEEGRKRYSAIGNNLFLPKRNDFHSNVEKWGTDKDHNLLAITGLSGSGKTTLTRALQAQVDGDTDIISMDFYWDNPAAPVFEEQRSKKFNSYLKKKVPEYNRIVKDFEKYDNIRFKNEQLTKNESKLKNEYWNTMDKVRDAMFDYARDSYPKTKVIAEGVQWLDTTLYDNTKVKNKILKDMPVIMLGTAVSKSSLRVAIRDGETILKGKHAIDYLKDRKKANVLWNTYMADLQEALK